MSHEHESQRSKEFSTQREGRKLIETAPVETFAGGSFAVVHGPITLSLQTEQMAALTKVDGRHIDGRARWETVRRGIFGTSPDHSGFEGYFADQPTEQVLAHIVGLVGPKVAFQLDMAGTAQKMRANGPDAWKRTVYWNRSKVNALTEKLRTGKVLSHEELMMCNNLMGSLTAQLRARMNDSGLSSDARKSLQDFRSRTDNYVRGGRRPQYAFQNTGSVSKVPFDTIQEVWTLGPDVDVPAAQPLSRTCLVDESEAVIADLIRELGRIGHPLARKYLDIISTGGRLLR